MEVGLGLPAGVPGTRPDALVDWARRADDGPFASVGVIDRLVYDTYDPLVALSAAAAVTARVQLVTCILIAPVREVASLAKQASSLDALSGGRLVLGLAIGARGDDYEHSEFRGRHRGDRLTEQLGQLHQLWDGGEMTPSGAVRGAPTVLVGGGAGSAFSRMARYADGYVHGGGPPRAFARSAAQATAAWADLGRPSRPSLWGQGYFALGDDAAERGRSYLLDYYAFAGTFATRIADGLLRTPLDVREFVGGYADAGCDHLVLLPAVPDSDQVDRLAEALR